MPMRTYKVVYSKETLEDIDSVVNYIISIYRIESGGDFVLVDRIIPSKLIKEL